METTPKAFTPAAQEASANIKAWREANPLPPGLLQVGQTLATSLSSTITLTKILGEGKTLCGHQGTHIEGTLHDYQRTFWFCRITDQGTIITPGGTLLVPLDEAGNPKDKTQWKPTEETPLYKDGPVFEIFPQFQSETEVIDRDGKIHTKSSLHKNPEETFTGIKKKIEAEAFKLVFPSPEEAEEAQNLAHAGHTQHEIRIHRHLRFVAAADKLARENHNFRRCAQLRSRLRERYSDMSKMPGNTRDFLWNIKENFPRIEVLKTPESVATLDHEGYIEIHCPEDPKHLHANYRYQGEQFLENPNPTLEEFEKSLPEKRKELAKARKKAESQTPSKHEEEPYQEEEPLVFSTEIATNIFSIWISHSIDSGCRGAVSETGYHSLLSKNTPTTAEEAQELLTEKWEETQKNHKTKPTPTQGEMASRIKGFDQAVIKHIGKSKLSLFLANLPRSNDPNKDLYYNVYHPAQAALDILQTTKAWQKIQKLKALKLSPQELFPQLIDVAQQLEGVHAPGSEARSLKWMTLRELFRLGRNLKIESPTATILPFTKTQREWNETGKYFFPGHYRTPLGTLIPKTGEDPNPKDIPSKNLLNLENEEEKPEPEEKPQRTKQTNQMELEF